MQEAKPPESCFGAHFAIQTRAWREPDDGHGRPVIVWSPRSPATDQISQGWTLAGLAAASEGSSKTSRGCRKPCRVLRKPPEAAGSPPRVLREPPEAAGSPPRIFQKPFGAAGSPRWVNAKSFWASASLERFRRKPRRAAGSLPRFARNGRGLLAASRGFLESLITRPNLGTIKAPRRIAAFAHANLRNISVFCSFRCSASG
jgi:hypothetical protein